MAALCSFWAREERGFSSCFKGMLANDLVSIYVVIYTKPGMVGPGAPLQNMFAKERALLKILQEPHYTDCTESPSNTYSLWTKSFFTPSRTADFTLTGREGVR
jgi:hypothetical protein